MEMLVASSVLETAAWLVSLWLGHRACWMLLQTSAKQTLAGQGWRVDFEMFWTDNIQVSEKYGCE